MADGACPIVGGIEGRTVTQGWRGVKHLTRIAPLPVNQQLMLIRYIPAHERDPEELKRQTGTQAARDLNGAGTGHQLRELVLTEERNRGEADLHVIAQRCLLYEVGKDRRAGGGRGRTAD